MLPKKYRLPIQGFTPKSTVLSRGKLLTIKTAPNNLGYNRFGVVISKGRIKLATQRNLTKRAILDFFKKTSRGVSLNVPTHDYLIIINPGRGKIEKREIIEELEKNGRNF